MGTLSARTVRRLGESPSGGGLVIEEHYAAGVFRNELGTREANRLGQAFASLAIEKKKRSDPPAILVGHDGRAVAAELAVAFAEGLRWGGCAAVDVGPISAPCAVFAIEHFALDGGAMVGNPLGKPHTAGLRFWLPGKRPFRTDSLAERYCAGVDRPTREAAESRFLAADEAYRDTLAELYHALRPLCVVVECECRPIERMIRSLIGSLPCRIVFHDPSEGRLAERVLAERAHFGFAFRDDGLKGELLDEQGRAADFSRVAGADSNDALRTFSHLLVLFSQSDRAVSEVL